jgi:hypothetical protein
MPVSLHVWRVPRRRLGAAFLRMARDPRAVRSQPGVRFAKLLGTSTGDTFGAGDADLTRWAAVVVADRVPEFPAWDRISTAKVTVEMSPLHSRGTWAKQRPFEPSVKDKPDGMVLAMTRARLRPVKALTFWRAVPPVVAELDAAPGLLARIGIGEAPIGWQGTITVWRGATDLTGFAYRQPEHRAVIARTPTDKWYAEDLFARFAVRRITGDRTVLGWVEKGDQGDEADAMRPAR